MRNLCRYVVVTPSATPAGRRSVGADDRHLLTSPPGSTPGSRNLRERRAPRAYWLNEVGGGGCTS
jgi:hypothetical protein